MSSQQQANPFELLNSKLDLVLSHISKIEINQSIAENTIEEDFIDLNGAAQILHMPPSSIHFHKKNNDLPFTKVGRRVLFLRKELLEWVSKNNKRNQDKLDVPLLKFKSAKP